MKIRKFYPSQVLRRLSGQTVASLTPAQLTAFNLGMRLNRRLGLHITITDGVITVIGPEALGRKVLAELRKAMGTMTSRPENLAPAQPAFAVLDEYGFYARPDCAV